ncbi:general stress protein [Thalassorhabdus alkalitolerans]|uniref:General stress protein n=1 Tax=Thalassorhabdus alkalitolerans TaxID=2282697 RepID=A0ABW0YK76_9BACI
MSTHTLLRTDEEVMEKVESLKSQGINENNIYVLSHDKQHTNQLADETDANTVGTTETGLDTTVKNLFRKKGDELRAKMQEMGIDEAEANELEEELDEGKILVVVKDEGPDANL